MRIQIIKNLNIKNALKICKKNMVVVNDPK